MPKRFTTQAYRYPNEQIILWLTIFLVLVIIAITATATVCLSGFFVIFAVGMAYYAGAAHQRELLEHAQVITPQNRPPLAQIIRESAERLQVEPLQVFLVRSRALNAYTFGLSSPKAIVLHDSLFQVMDREELQFIIGHEMGHVHLGHTWLNSLVGGMAGIPASGSATLLLVLALRWWNRACEYSADRAGLLACSQPQKAISALIKLEAGAHANRPEAIREALERIEAQDDDLGNNLSEMLATHPMIIKRIEQLRDYIRSSQYQQLQARMNENLSEG